MKIQETLRKQTLCAAIALALINSSPCTARNPHDVIVLNFPDKAEVGTLQKVAPGASYWDEHPPGKTFTTICGKVKIPPDTQLGVTIVDTLIDPFAILEKIPPESVYSLTMSGSTFITDKNLPKLLRFKKLKRLQLDRTELTDAGIATVKNMSTLECLVVSHTRLTGATLSQLCPLTNLRHLDIGSNALDGTKLASLECLPNLQWLSIGRSHLRDPHLVFLERTKNIKILELFNNHLISNKGMVYVAKLPHLEQLKANETSIGFAGLRQLKGAKSLDFVKVSANAMSPTELKTLHSILPKTTIRIDDGPAKSFKLFKELLD